MDVFGTYIYIHGVYKPTNITGAPRLMTTDEIIQLQVLGPTKIDEKPGARCLVLGENLNNHRICKVSYTTYIYRYNMYRHKKVNSIINMCPTGAQHV